MCDTVLQMKIHTNTIHTNSNYPSTWFSKIIAKSNLEFKTLFPWARSFTLIA